MRTNFRAVKARTVFAAAGLVLASGLTACGAGSTPAAEVKTFSAADVDPAAAAALPERYKNAGVIKVASDIPYPPMEMFDENQQLTGLDFDLAQALGAKLGVKLELQTQAFDSIIPSLQSGKNDIIMSGMNDTPERQESLDFVDYFHAGFSILVPEGNPKNITTALDLCDMDVAVQKATVQAEILRSYDQPCADKGSSLIRVSELPLETDVQTAVRSGKAAADVVDSAVAAYAAKTAGGGAIFDLVKDPANPAGYNPVYTGIGVLKKDAELSKALLTALQALIADGTYDTILAKYDLSDYAVKEAGLNLGGTKP
ncbi:ABC-type amino acid transport substrate-binding protein [Arthrobacter sp. V4I6]|uniref:ABC transporter substrate-binding protein n=1 Tax=unclassified Arthrobacter TaxID=235627 RepID=UPI002783217C|nr:MULTISPECIES: ABC transporter substrate-binding protein [unclassified Arthrobacter]MDQ0823149.1 ABC-type amino acid transport substrate-binding protein [Arthrobacter sp. V1I7]MDQ0852780.1 ABC-type amino acid transport substrate-binding protein [Arthrobacter sp. V4I6]